MMNPKRLTVKFFIQEPERVSLEPFIPVFHRWIQEKAVAGLLIDVADYKHIQDGPGVILLGDEVDYAIDLGKGRPGLLLRDKRRRSENGSLPAQISEALLLAARACRLLETEPALDGRVAFRSGEIEIAFQDRLAAPNTGSTFGETLPELRQLLGQVYPEHEIQLRLAAEDPREAFTVHAQILNAPALDSLIKNLEAVLLPAAIGRSR
jgi:hypothetical protein